MSTTERILLNEARSRNRLPTEKTKYEMTKEVSAKYTIGQIVKHRIYPFRGIIFDVDPEFSNSEEWWLSIPEKMRPHKEQPFYHLFAENEETEYIAYVSEQNLLPDDSGKPVRHPQIDEVFVKQGNGNYKTRDSLIN